MPQDFGSGNAGTDCATCPVKTENIIVIGSEFYYPRSGFHLKLMFMACGYAVASGTLVPSGYSAADRLTIAYVPLGYNRQELLNLDFLRNHLKANIVRLTTKSDFLDMLRNRVHGGKRYNIKNLVIFSHGLPHYIDLNYTGPGEFMEIYSNDMTGLPSDLFTSDGKIHSYACRTATGNYAQALADHFRVTVRAFKRRTYYGNVIRDGSDHAAIAAAMKAARAGHEGEVISLPPEHEAYPHAGLSAGRIPIISDGGEAEGINDYALWRLNGARILPESAETPEEEPTGIHMIGPR